MPSSAKDLLIAEQLLNANMNRRIWGDMIYNVRVYGAKGDGNADDSVAIIKAINAAAGGLVFFPPGIYRVPGDFVIPTTAKICGDNAIFIGIPDVIPDLFGYTTPYGPRSVIQYKNATTVYVSGRTFVMGGFRFKGQYSKKYAPSAEISTYPAQVSTTTDLGAESALTHDNWLAVFAVKDTDGSAKLKIIPFLRVSSIDGNVVTLGNAGELQNPATLRSYNFNADILKNTECLIINETIDGRQHSLSGRITTITGNTSSTVTLEDAGNMIQGDYFLPSPPGYAHYCYLGCFYFDADEVRNIVDSGTIVKTQGISLTNSNAGVTIDGTLPASGVDVSLASTISPLSTAVIMDVKQSFATAGTGEYALWIGHDSNHVNHTWVDRKENESTGNYYFGGIISPFFYQQVVNVKSGGDANLQTNAIRQFEIRGWIEP
jgi:hypothetical protein